MLIANTARIRHFSGSAKDSGNKPVVYVQFGCGNKALPHQFYIGQSSNGHAGRYCGRRSPSADRLDPYTPVKLLLIEADYQGPTDTWWLRDELKDLEGILRQGALERGLDSYCATSRARTKDISWRTRQDFCSIIKDALDEIQSMVLGPDSLIKLVPGDSIALTGTMSVSRPELAYRAAQKGVFVGRHCTKYSKAVIAADPMRNTEKLVKALNYGIPIKDEAWLDAQLAAL